MADAVQKWCKKVTIYTVDNDVVVLYVASSSKTASDELSFAFGVGTNFRCIAMHGCRNESNNVSDSPSIQAFTGCDSVFSFVGRWKKIA